MTARSSFLLLVVLFIHASPLSASSPGAAFLRTNPDARTAGLGGSSAVSGGVLSLAGNPGGLAGVRRGQASLTQVSLPLGDTQHWLGYARPAGGGVWGAGLRQLSRQPMERRGEGRAYQGDLPSTDRALGLGYGRVFGGGLSAGLVLNHVQSRVGDESAATWAVDGGMCWAFSAKNLNVGLAARNLGPGLKIGRERAPLPALVNVGARYDLPFGFSGVMEVSRDVYAQKIFFRVGTEYGVMGRLFLRGGYEGAPGGENVSVGAGWRWRRFRLDYAVTPQPYLGDRHVLSLTLGL